MSDRIRSRSLHRGLAALLTAAPLFAGCKPAGDTAPAAETERAAPSVRAAVVDEAEAERLMALGYVDVVADEADAGADGAQRIDPARTAPGLTFYVNAPLCSADLIDSAGRLLHRWSHEPCRKWANAILRQDGSILAIHRAPGETAAGGFVARRVLSMDWNGELQWSTPIAAHHDLDVLADGRIAVLTDRHRAIPSIHPTIPVRDHDVALLSPAGELLETVSLVEILQASPDTFPLRTVRPREHEGKTEVDLIHSNSIEWMRNRELAEQNPLYATNNFLFCSRNQNAIAIVDWETRRVVWSWGSGTLSGPHDATVLDSGNILVFDNGLNRRYSRVIEVDPRTNQVVWSYQAPEPERFFTSHRGAAQRLENGNTLITDSGAGRAFEVTPAGERVWSYGNPNRSEDGKRAILVRTRRISESDIERPEFGWSD